MRQKEKGGPETIPPLAVTSLGTVLVSGASGFIGRHLLAALQVQGETVLAMVRRPLDRLVANTWRLADLRDPRALEHACEGVHTLFHCAGHAHAFAAGAQSALHHEINYMGTQNLLHAAAKAGVSRFVFLSSVKAMGEPGVHRVDEQWSALPQTPYGKAKRAAEDALWQSAAATGMHAVCLRLAMVYGQGSRGNLERIIAGVRKGWFPPLPAKTGLRSLVHVDDVVAAAILAARSPLAAGKTYLVADPQPYSAAQMYDAVRLALGLPPPRWRCSGALLRAGGRCGQCLQFLLGRPLPLNREVVDRLMGAEQYCPDRIMRELGWRPQVSLATGLQQACGRCEVDVGV